MNNRKQVSTRRFLLLLSLALLMLTAGCGRRENPRPPEERAPSPVRFLSGTSDVNSLTLRWYTPLTTAEGEELLDLSGFHVLRRELEKDSGSSFKIIEEINIAKASSPTKGEGHTVASGDQYSFRDTSIEAGKRYEYLVLPVNSEGIEGEPGNLIRVFFVGNTSVVESITF